MLEMFRNAGKTWVAKILLLLLAASFGVWGIQDVFSGYRADALVTVGKQEVTTEEYQTSFRTSLQNWSRQNNRVITPEEARKQGFDREILEGLISGAALDGEAKTLKLAISPQIVDDNIKNSPQFKDATGAYNPVLFKGFLQQQGLNSTGYIDRMTRAGARESILGAVGGGFVTPRTLLEAIYLYNNQQRDAKYFDVAMTAADVPAPTDDELKKQYEANPTAYTAPEYRSIAIMKVEPSDLTAKITVTDQELKDAYEKGKNQFGVVERRSFQQLSYPDLKAAKAAQEQLARSGMNFSALAKAQGATESDITFNDKAKTDLIDPVIADKVFAMPEGAVSGPIDGKLVTAIVKVTKVVPGHQMSFDEAKPQLTKMLQNQKALDEIQTLADAVENARNNKTQSFEAIAKDHSIPFILVPAVSAAGLDPQNGDVSLPAKPELIKSAFDSDVGVENDALTLQDSYIWYEVREVKPSQLKPFDIVRDQVKNDVIAAKLRSALMARGEALVAELKGGKNLEQLAQDNKTAVKTAQGLRRSEAGAGFDKLSVSALFNVSDTGFASSLNPDGKSVRIMQAQPVLLTPFDPESESSKAIAQNVATTASQDLSLSYLAALKKQTGVVVNELLWQQATGDPVQAE